MSTDECLKWAERGQDFLAKKDFVNCIDSMMQALSIGTADLNVLSSIYSQLGNAHLRNGNVEKALEFHGNDLLLSKLLDDRDSEAKSCDALGTLWRSLGVFQDAVTFFERQLTIAKERHDRKMESRAFYNLAISYQHRGKEYLHHLKESKVDADGCNSTLSLMPTFVDNMERCIEYFECYLLASDERADEQMQCRVYTHLGAAQYLLGDFQSAIENYEMAHNISMRLNDTRAQRRSLTNLGHAYQQVSDVNKANECYRSALALAEDGNIPLRGGDKEENSSEPRTPLFGEGSSEDDLFDQLIRVQGRRLDEQRFSWRQSSSSDISQCQPAFACHATHTVVPKERTRSSQRFRSLMGRINKFNPLSTSTPLKEKIDALSSLVRSPSRVHKESRSRSQTPSRNSVVSLGFNRCSGPIPFELDHSSTSACSHYDIIRKEDEEIERRHELDFSFSPKKDIRCPSKPEELDDKENIERESIGLKSPIGSNRLSKMSDVSETLKNLLLSPNEDSLNERRATLPGLKDASELNAHSSDRVRDLPPEVPIAEGLTVNSPKLIESPEGTSLVNTALTPIIKTKTRRRKSFARLFAPMNRYNRQSN